MPPGDDDSSSEGLGDASPVERMGSPGYRAAAAYEMPQDLTETFKRAKQRVGGTLLVDKAGRQDFTNDVDEMRALSADLLARLEVVEKVRVSFAHPRHTLRQDSCERSAVVVM